MIILELKYFNAFRVKYFEVSLIDNTSLISLNKIIFFISKKYFLFSFDLV